MGKNKQTKQNKETHNVFFTIWKTPWSNNKNIPVKIIQSSKWGFDQKEVCTAIVTPVLISASINWNGLPKEAVKSPPLEIFKTQRDKSWAMCSGSPWFNGGSEGGDGAKLSPEILFNLNYSMIRRSINTQI